MPAVRGRGQARTQMPGQELTMNLRRIKQRVARWIKAIIDSIFPPGGGGGGHPAAMGA